MSPLRFLTAGSVDDGKSTLIGRLFYDCGIILDDQLQSISKKGINFAHLTDGLKEEREKGITIDVAYKYFETNNRKFIVADAPGHKEFTRNMISAASKSDAILLLIDGSRGVTDQTLRHFFIAQWLGIKNYVFLINKMDLLNYSEEFFSEIKRQLPEDIHSSVIPISALLGENILTQSQFMPWYKGPTLFEWLHQANISQINDYEKIRFPVQLTSGYEVMGCLKSGRLVTGAHLRVNGTDEVIIEEIYSYPHQLSEALPFMPLRLKLNKKLKRGDFIHESNHTPLTSKVWEAEWCFMNTESLPDATPLILKYETNEVEITQIVILQEYDFQLLSWKESISSSMQTNDIYRGKISMMGDLMADPDTKFVIIDTISCQTIAAGKLLNPLPDDHF